MFCQMISQVHKIVTYDPNMWNTCPNNLSLWQSMTKPQQTNEHMREVINHLTHIHLLNTIKSILSQNLETCKKRVYDK